MTTEIINKLRKKLRNLSSISNLAKGIEKIKTCAMADDYPANINIYFISTRSKNNNIYEIQATDKSKKIIADALIAEVDKSSFKERSVDDYDLAHTPRDCHLRVKIEEFPTITEFLSYFTPEKYESILQAPSSEQLKTIDYYLVDFESDQNGKEKYKIIGKFSDFTKIQRKTIFGNYSEGRIDLGKNDQLTGLNRKPEIVIFGNEELIINSADAVFDSLFSIKNYITSSAKKNLESHTEIKSILKEGTISRLLSKISNDKRLSATLLKAMKDRERFKATITNIHNIKLIINNKSHPLHDKVRDISFQDGFLNAPEGKEKQLIAALSDPFYKAIISETENIDKSRYNA